MKSRTAGWKDESDRKRLKAGEDWLSAAAIFGPGAAGELNKRLPTHHWHLINKRAARTRKQTSEGDWSNSCYANPNMPTVTLRETTKVEPLLKLATLAAWRSGGLFCHSHQASCTLRLVLIRKCKHANMLNAEGEHGNAITLVRISTLAFSLWAMLLFSSK